MIASIRERPQSSWGRSLKHNGLFPNQFDTISKVRSLVALYVEEHNTRLPHSAFRGQTPDEMYFGAGDEVPDRLVASHRAAREARLRTSRAERCAACP